MLRVVIGTLQKWAKTEDEPRAAAAPGFCFGEDSMTGETGTPPPETRAVDAAVWAHVRARYEQAQETVEAIATSIGMTTHALVQKARELGWRLRGAKVSAARKARQETTTATIRRLKELLQSRVAQLEQQLKDIGEDVSALGSERDIRATNTLVRTLEKVLDLERKDRTRRQQAKRAFKHFDDAQRDALARKIEGLEAQWHGPQAEPDAGWAGGDGT